MSVEVRAQLPGARRVVVKVGSSSISGENAGKIQLIVEALAEAHGRGTEVVLVSSGAIATGMPYLALDERPVDLATQQAAAAVGQNVLIYRYQDALRPFAIVAGQVLLTAGDLENPTPRGNAQRALERLLHLRILPIVNENDTVATHEIRFGDNDRLAALIAHLVRADALILMSDVDALYTAHPDTPGAERIDRVENLAKLKVDTSRLGSRVGTGGMRTKLLAADIATQAGVSVVLGHADDLGAALAGEDVGTFFPARKRRRPRRLLWLAFAAEPRGRLHVDDGASIALRRGKASLLAAGITRVEGTFAEGEPVEIVGAGGEPLGRGFVGYSSAELAAEAGHSSAEEGHEEQRPAVHRDQMMLAD